MIVILDTCRYSAKEGGRSDAARPKTTMQVVLRKYQRAKPRKCWGTFANKGLLNCTALTMLLHWSCTDSPPAPWWQPGWGDRDGQGVQTQVWEEEQGEISGGDGWWDTDVGFVTQGSKKSGNLKSDGLDFGDGTEHGKYRRDNKIQESKPRSFQRARVAGAREGGKTCRYTGCPWRRCWGVSNVEVSVELFVYCLLLLFNDLGLLDKSGTQGESEAKDKYSPKHGRRASRAKARSSRL